MKKEKQKLHFQEEVYGKTVLSFCGLISQVDRVLYLDLYRNEVQHLKTFFHLA